MKQYEPSMSFGEEVAEIYDAEPDVSQHQDLSATVAFLEELAGGGTALELAIGTGRVALPLAARGMRVDGIDFSPAMVAKLRAKPGGDQLAVTIGDFAEVPVEGSYRLIYLVFNTLFNLLTQDDQVRCFENVATHLTEDGAFVVEAFVPTWLTRLRDDQYVDAEAIEVDEVTFDVGRHDPVKQLLYESHVLLSREGVRVYPIVTRYAWPSELDLMARIAGLRLKERWAGWSREPFTGASRSHVSVYGR
jgi:SAM-dependent methyltransferase